MMVSMTVMIRDEYSSRKGQVEKKRGDRNGDGFERAMFSLQRSLRPEHRFTARFAGCDPALLQPGMRLEG
jgi:hypothetical protein